MNKLVTAYGLNITNEFHEREKPTVLAETNLKSFHLNRQTESQGHLLNIPISETRTLATEQATETSRSLVQNNYGKHFFFI